MPIPTTLRSLARSRALSLTVVLTLAIGVAALTTTFVSKLIESVSV